jgi:allantoinase
VTYPGWRSPWPGNHRAQPAALAGRPDPVGALPAGNDSSTIIDRKVDAHDFATMVIDQFDELPEQSRARPRVMGIALHAMIAGQPSRLRALRRAFEHLAAHRDRCWLTTAGEVADAVIDAGG